MDFTADLLCELVLLTGSPDFGSNVNFLEVCNKLVQGIKCQIEKKLHIFRVSIYLSSVPHADTTVEAVQEQVSVLTGSSWKQASGSKSYWKTYTIIHLQYEMMIPFETTHSVVKLSVLFSSL